MTDHAKIFFDNIQTIIGMYLIPIVCTPGLIGNILCLTVFLTKSMKRYVTIQFLFFLALSDTIKLSNDLLYSVVLIIQSVDQYLGTQIFRQLYRPCHYINAVSTFCTAWFTLTIAIERYILCSTHSQTRLVIQKRSRSICYIIILLSLVMSLPVLCRYEVVPLSSNETLINANYSAIRPSKFGSSRYFRLYSILFDLTRAIIPSLFLFYLNTRIIYCLSKKKSSAGRAFSRLTISLIIIIGCFICCYFPDALLSLILNMGYVDETYQKRAIREITDFFVTLNSSTNFGIYFSISYTFRRSLRKLCERPTKHYNPTTYEDLIQRQRLHQRQAKIISV